MCYGKKKKIAHKNGAIYEEVNETGVSGKIGKNFRDLNITNKANSNLSTK